jgi:hypothetical protein
LKRSKGLRRVPMAPKRNVAQHRAKQRGIRLAEKRKAWHDYVVRVPCVMCRMFPPTAEDRQSFGFLISQRRAHHVLEKHELKKFARTRGIDADEMLLWDIQNGMCLCEWHHQRHHQHKQRVPRTLLDDDHFQFAAKWKLDWYLDTLYPPEALPSD